MLYIEALFADDIFILGGTITTLGMYLDNYLSKTLPLLDPFKSLEGLIKLKNPTDDGFDTVSDDSADCACSYVARAIPHTAQLIECKRLRNLKL